MFGLKRLKIRVKRLIIQDFKRLLKSDPEATKLIMPSTCYEIYLDLNGDGKGDFALIDRDRNGFMDTVAVDVTGDGSYDLYVSGSDESGTGDVLSFYPDGSFVPTKIVDGPVANKRLLPVLIDALKRQETMKSAQGAVETCRTYAGHLYEVYKSMEADGLAKETGESNEDRKFARFLQSFQECAEHNEFFARAIVPAGVNEFFFATGDAAPGTADIGIIDDNMDGLVDTFAIDTTGNGEFNFYLVDTDFNDIPDVIRYYEDGNDQMAGEVSGKEVEEYLGSATRELYDMCKALIEHQDLLKGNSASPAELLQKMDAVVKRFKQAAVDAYNALRKRAAAEAAFVVPVRPGRMLN